MATSKKLTTKPTAPASKKTAAKAEKSARRKKPSESAGLGEMNKAKWAHYQFDRLMHVWQVVALSYGVEPTEACVYAVAKKRAGWKEDFLQRTAYLSRRLSEHPTAGYITFIKDHPAAKVHARWQIVDTLTAIEALEKRYASELPLEFLGLKKYLESVPQPTPPGWLSQAAPSQLPLVEKKKKSNDERNRSVEQQKLLRMLYAVARGHGYNPVESIADQKRVIGKMFEEIEDSWGGRYGMSLDQFKKSLKEGHTLYLDKDS